MISWIRTKLQILIWIGSANPHQRSHGVACPIANEGTAFKWKLCSHWRKAFDKVVYCSLSNTDPCTAISGTTESARPRPVGDFALRWRHNERDSVSNHQPYECLLNRLFTRRSKKISKLHVTGLCTGNSPETGEFPAQRASNAEFFSIWWRHHGLPRPVIWWETYMYNVVFLFSRSLTLLDV